MTAAVQTAPQKISRQEQKRQLEHHFAEDLDSLTFPLLADIYISEGQISRAKRVCLIGLDRHPNHPAGLYLAATLAIRDGDLAAAEKFLLQTLQADEYHVRAAELLVAVQERLKRKKPVLEQAYRKLLYANPLSRAAHERLDHLLSEKKILEDIRRDLAGSYPEEATVSEETAPPPAEPETETPPPEPTPVIPVEPESEGEETTVAEIEAPVPEGTALADLEEILEEEPPIKEAEEEVFEVPAVEKEAAVDTVKEEARPQGVVSETEAKKQVAKEEIFEPGVATKPSPDAENEQELVDVPDQQRKESGFEPGRSDLMEAEETVEPVTDQMDEEVEEDRDYPPDIVAETSDESAQLTEYDQVKAEEAILTQPDIETFNESISEEPADLKDEITSRETTEVSEPVSAVDKQDRVDEYETLIDTEQDSITEDKVISGTDDTTSDGLLADHTPTATGEAVVSESRRQEESFEPGSGIDKPSPPPSAKDQEARAEEPYQPEGKILARDTARENEFLEDYAEPTKLSADKIDGLPVTEELPEDEQGESGFIVEEASDDSGDVEEIFEPGAEADPEAVVVERVTEDDLSQLEGDTPPTSTMREAEFLDDHAEPRDIDTEKSVTSHATEELPGDGEKEPIVSTEEGGDFGEGIAESFEPAAEDDDADTVLQEFDEEASPTPLKDDSPSEPGAETTAEGDADLMVEQDIKEYPEVPADSVEEEAPVSPAMMDDAARYWAEALDSEGRPFESQSQADTLEEMESATGDEFVTRSDTSEETDEFEPGQADLKPEVSDSYDDADRIVPVDDKPAETDMGESEHGEAAVELVEIESDTEAEKTAIEKEEESFDPSKKLAGEESPLDTDKAEATPPASPDIEDHPTDSAASLSVDDEKHDFVEVDIEEPETGEIGAPAIDDEMRSGEQERAEDIVSREDSFEPTSIQDDGLDTDEPGDPEEPIPAPEGGEPYQPDMQKLLEEIRDIHLEETDISDSAMHYEKAPDELDSGVEQGEPLTTDEQIVSMEAEATDKAEAFEPGASEMDETAPESLDSLEKSMPAESDDGVAFEPGEHAVRDESEIQVESKRIATATEVRTADGDLPDTDLAESEIDKPGTSRPEGSDKQKDQFEPGRAAGEETTSIDDIARPPGIQEVAKTSEDKAWDEESLVAEVPAEEGDLSGIAVLSEEPSEQQEDLPTEAAEEEAYVEKETISASETEGGDVSGTGFKPGEGPALEESPADLAAPDSQAIVSDLHTTDTPGLATVDTSGDDDLEVLEKAAYDSQEMRGESFEPSTRIPAQEDIASGAAEDTDLTADETEEMEPEIPGDQDTVSEEHWLDPKLATFTLATIYKVQGLYQQALQVLDLLAGKGADPDRIAAERDSILQQMGSRSSEED